MSLILHNKMNTLFNPTTKKMFSEGSYAHFLYRQFFVTPKPASRDAIDLSGQTGIVTGSNIGLGLEASRQLLQLGLTHLILAVRDETKGAAAKADLQSINRSKTNIEVWKIDMESYDSINAFAKRAEGLPRLDFAILNAGVFKTKLEILPSTGYEATVQVNFLSTALLAIMLLPILCAGRASNPNRPGRLTITSSETAEWAKFKEQKSNPLLPSFNDPKLFDIGDRYYTSKLLGLIFLREFSRKVPASSVVINAVNPGFCYGSGLLRETNGALGAVLSGVKRGIGRTTSVGARTLVNAAVVQDDSTHGKYLGDNKVKPFATFITGKNGPAMETKLWGETIDLLEGVAPVNTILKSIKRE